MSNAADSCVFVIFGASGDLARKKLLPAIYNLAEAKLLPEEFAILGIARPAIDQDAYRAQMRERVREVEGDPLEADTWHLIEERLYYVSGEFDDPALYERIAGKLSEIARVHHTPPNYLFYFAIPPEMFGPVGRHLGESGLARQRDGWRRVVVEKPFGYDLESARTLNQQLTASFDEPQIYRIDHYLGKETVQNILAFRFANGIFEPIWNRRYVDHVQMTVAEEVGVEKRGAYYEKAGALRDIVQNHMLQLLALVAMEPPISFGADDVRDEKVKVLHAIERMDPGEVKRLVVRGQYEGYRSEPNVNPDSRTETYVALRLKVDNWRWAGVPFYLRTGKKLESRVTQVAIQFNCAPLMLFRDTPVHSLSSNVLVLRIQPDEGISLSFNAKVPGPFERLEPVTMDFSYRTFFKAEPATGYETLLFDVMVGDQTLFHRMDIVEAGWSAVMPILDAWRRDSHAPPATYAPGSRGPSEADLLVEHGGRQWRP